jgi:hypothetical protein
LWDRKTTCASTQTVLALVRWLCKKKQNLYSVIKHPSRGTIRTIQVSWPHASSASLEWIIPKTLQQSLLPSNEVQLGPALAGVLGNVALLRLEARRDLPYRVVLYDCVYCVVGRDSDVIIYHAALIIINENDRWQQDVECLPKRATVLMLLAWQIPHPLRRSFRNTNT